jgi:hypothetical protein
LAPPPSWSAATCASSSIRTPQTSGLCRARSGTRANAARSSATISIIGGAPVRAPIRAASRSSGIVPIKR